MFGNNAGVAKSCNGYPNRYHQPVPVRMGVVIVTMPAIGVDV